MRRLELNGAWLLTISGVHRVHELMWCGCLSRCEMPENCPGDCQFDIVEGD